MPDSSAQAVTSSRTYNVTKIGGGNEDILNTISKKNLKQQKLPEKSKPKSVKINKSSKKPSNVNVVKNGSKV